MSRVLVVDTSLVGAQVAVLETDGARVLWQGAHRENQGSLTAISQLTSQALAATGLTPATVDGLALAVGPGSFTGIKVGLAFGYGLAASRIGNAKELGLLGVSALGAAARELQGPQKRVALFLGATRTHGFVAVVGGASGTSAAASAASGDGPLRESLVSCDGAATDVSHLFAGEGLDLPCVVAGNWPGMTDRLTALGRPVQSLTTESLCEHALKGLCAEAARAWPAGYGEDLPGPRYLRLSTAEEALVARAGPKP